MTLTKSYYTTRIFLIIPQNHVLLELITRLRRFRDKNLIDKLSPVVSGFIPTKQVSTVLVGWISVTLPSVLFLFHWIQPLLWNYNSTGCKNSHTRRRLRS